MIILILTNPKPSSDSAAPFGTWLVSDTPGEDSGYAYLKPTHDTLVPIGIEDADWNWLEGKEWKPIKEVKLVCKDDLTMGTHFYKVEFFQNNEVYTSFYTPPILLKSNKMTKEESLIDAIKSSPSLSRPSVWNSVKEEWMRLKGGEKDFTIICKLGGATMITDSKNRKTVGHLIQQETSSKGWILTFNRVAGTEKEEKDSKWNFEPEVIINLESTGKSKSSLRALSGEEELKYNTKMNYSLRDVKKGEYLWVWYHKSSIDKELKAENSDISSSCKNVDSSESDAACDGLMGAIDEILVCIMIIPSSLSILSLTILITHYLFQP
jgi:hypothetical protein